MSQPGRKHRQPWIVEETMGAFQVKDAGGAVLGEIRFGASSGSELTKLEAKKMADIMVEAGAALADATVVQQER